MSLYKAIKEKMKDGDIGEILRFVRIWMVCFLAFLIFYVGTGKIPLLVLVFVPLIMAVMGMVIIKKGARSPAVFMGDEKLAGPSKNN